MTSMLSIQSSSLVWAMAFLVAASMGTSFHAIVVGFLLDFIDGGDTVVCKPVLEFLPFEVTKLTHGFVVRNLPTHHQFINIGLRSTHVLDGFLSSEDCLGGEAFLRCSDNVG